MTEPPDVVESSRELASLVHHVELHRSGWWDRSLERLVTVTVWLKNPRSSAEIVSFLGEGIDHRVDSERVDDIIGRLEAGGSILRFGGHLKVSEEVADALSAEFAAAESEAVQLEDRLFTLATAAGIESDSSALWNDFEALFLWPFIKDAGARVYGLLSAKSNLDLSESTYSQLLEPICSKYGPSIRTVLIAFLDPHNQAVRHYMLRSLNAGFLREAAGLDEGVIATLNRARKQVGSLRILIDTNFLYSFLGLHENPGNPVAADLVALIEAISSSMNVKLYVLWPTVEEARRTIGAVATRLETLRAEANMAQAAQQVTSAGLLSTYLNAAAHHEGYLSPKAFFEPYENDLVTILEEKNIFVLAADLDSLPSDPEVVDDLHDLQEYQAAHRVRGVKPYDANMHDLLLWHYVKRGRPQTSDSPIDVGTWVCTLDYGLIAFDRKKRRGQRGFPICLTPSAFIQLLQFWAPRSTELDTALVGAMREPLLFLGFDQGSERVTIDILDALSRFEGVGDLPSSTILNILTNDALRGRLEGPDERSKDQKFEIVKDAVVEEVGRLQQRLSELESEKRTIEKEGSARSSDLERVTDDLAQSQSQADALRSKVEAAERAARTVQEESASKVAELQRAQDELLGEVALLRQEATDKAAAERTAKTERSALWRTVIRCFAGFLVAVIATFAIAWPLSKHLDAAWVAWAGVAVILAFCWLLYVEHCVSKLSKFKDLRAHKSIKWIRRTLGGVIIAVAASLLAAAIWQSTHPQKNAPHAEQSAEPSAAVGGL